MIRRAILAILLVTAVPCFATTYTVNALTDEPDAIPGNNQCDIGSGFCTLRAAIMEANAHAGADTIVFNVSGTITPATAYPSITEKLTIDGTGAPGYVVALPVVIVDGNKTVTVGFDIALGADQSVLNGLLIRKFSTAGVMVEAAQSGVIACQILSNLGDGIQISGSQDFAGSVTGGVNVISGNGNHGVLISAGSGHTILHNRIGTNAAGTAALANVLDGIHVQNASSFTIGSASAGNENVISGNSQHGIALDTVSGITIAGNLIGLDVTGTLGLGNKTSGVELTAATNCNVGSASARNVISDNNLGVRVNSGSGVVIGNNYLGSDATGTAALGNSTAGVQVLELAPGTVVGTTTLPNLSSGNGNGVIIDADNVVVKNNIIGLDKTGVNILGNSQFGIIVSDSRNNPTIGGSAANEGNVISGNGQDGIAMGFTTGGTVAGNTIGLKADRTAIRGNGGDGIHLSDCSGVTIGGAAAGAGNYISGNSTNGIETGGGEVGSTNLTIRGNLVGTDGTGLLALGNDSDGMYIENTTASSIVANVVSGNGADGIQLDFGVSGVTLTQNIIGRTATNSGPLPNSFNGISLTGDANGNMIGGAGVQNTIASNTKNGVDAASTTNNNLFAVNSIFGNTLLGIDLDDNGVTTNDSQDPDTGANARQNFPTPVYGQTSVNGTQAGGTINSNPNTALSIHIYSSPAVDPSGNGEGQTYLGSTNVTTDINGNASWVVNSSTPSTAGQFLTSTANGPNGTSEFSGAVTLVASPTVQFSLANYTVNENAGSATITVTRTGDLTGSSTVQYATSNGTATQPSDYTTATGTLTFAPTVASQTFPVPIINDTLGEPNETVNLTLSNPSNATLGAQSTAILTIIDNDTPSITISDVSLNEGNSGTTTFGFVVMLSNLTTQTVTVGFSTAPGTATAGTDYTTTSGTATIPPNTLTTTINIPVLGDTTFEPNETFFVNLGSPVNATIADNQALGTIMNDDSLCSAITVNPSTLPQAVVTVPYFLTLTASGGTTPYTYTITSGALPTGLSLNAATGVISGIPQQSGSFNVTIQATDSLGCLATPAPTYSLAVLTPTGGPTLSVVGLMILMTLLAIAGLYVMNKLSI